MDKVRLDIIISEQFNIGREKAKEFINKGYVSLDNKILTKSGQKYDKDIFIKLDMPSKQFVSRGGYKLDKALDVFNIDVNDKICIDVGASTGGFTDCLLQNNAKKIYAIDSGTGQLVDKLKNNNKVINMEKTNIRYLDKTSFDQLGEIVTIDVSFISITKILQNVRNLIETDATIICLIKPQFELTKKHLNNKGIVKEHKFHILALKNIYNYLVEEGYYINNLIDSPIKGKDGNKEYLLYLSNKYDKCNAKFDSFLKNIN